MDIYGTKPMEAVDLMMCWRLMCARHFFAMDSSEREWGQDIFGLYGAIKFTFVWKEKMDEQRYSFVTWQRYAY